MTENCDECLKKSAEIAAVQRMYRGKCVELLAMEAETLRNYANYDSKLATLRLYVAEHKRDEAMEQQKALGEEPAKT